MKSDKNILRKSMSSGSNADFMLYQWRNVPRSDRYSPTQLMFGRAQRTSLPSLPSQNVPIDFSSAASSKDAAHARAKLDHDRSKLSLASLSLRVKPCTCKTLNHLRGISVASLCQCDRTAYLMSLRWITGFSPVLDVSCGL